MKKSYKNILLIFVSILLIGGSFVYAEYNNIKNKEVYSSQNSNGLETIKDLDSDPRNNDSDGDGSKDWEEVLAGSNPNDPKSKPSTSNTPIVEDKTNTPKEKLSQIDIISRDFFARYMQLKQAGLANDKDSQNELITKTIGNIVVSKPDEYKLSEIIVINDNSNEALSSYIEQVAKVYRKYLINSRNEAIIVKESLEKEDPEILKELNPIIQSYKNIINGLIKIKAPSSIADLHLNLINSMNGVLFVAQSFNDSNINPIKGLQGLQYFQTAQESLFQSMTSIRDHYKSIGIYEDIF